MADISSLQKDRSTSRGREFSSSGRGGVGNFRQPSVSRGPVDRASIDGPDDFSPTRGRERNNAFNTDKVVSVGRGGAGNIRSPSRARGEELSDDRDRIRAIDESTENHAHSSGRGGLGNIILSKSRSRSRGPGNVLVHGTGRGGVGNIKPGEPVDVEIRQVEDAERAAYPVSPGVHSTGRGGVANLTDTTAPPIERVPPGPGHPHASHAHEFESTGRGGAGNIRSRSVSQGADGRSPSKDRAEKHGISALFQRVARSGSRPPKDDKEVSSVAEE